MATITSQSAENALLFAAAVPKAMLEALSARCRSGGLCLMMMSTDARLLWYDDAAPEFFQTYLIPQLKSRELIGNDFWNGLSAVTASSSPAVWSVLPGLTAAVSPYIERKVLRGALIVAARNTAFEPISDIVKNGSRLNVAPATLFHNAEQLPGYSDRSLLYQAHILQSSMRDMQRLSGLEKELVSISGQLTDTYEELSLIYQISGGMKINRRPVDFFRQACLDSIEVMGVGAMGVALHSSDTLCQLPVVFGSLSLPAGKAGRLSSELLSVISTRKSPLLLNSLRNDKQFNWLADNAERLLVVPLQRGEKVLGCLYALDKDSGDFDSVDSKLLTSIANESAIYLENALLFEDVRGLMMGLLHSLTSAVDAKDTYTRGHSERVAAVSKLLAQQFGLDEMLVERIYMAGLLHDVGKIGVPELVLGKPGKLTVDEFEQMKRHPAIGATILQDVKQIQDIVPGVLHHHERFDGRGYPEGLSGQDIPLMGRIICLADCFDAMTSTRTYRNALPLEVTLADIRRCGGTQFDPALTEAFLNIPAETLRGLVLQQAVPEHYELNRSPSLPNEQPKKAA